MFLETFLVSILVGGAAWFAVARSVSRWHVRLAVALNVFVVIFVLGSSWQTTYSQPPAPEQRPKQVAESGYVGSQSCRSCHPKQHGTWQASYHSRMTQVASPDSVQGDFGDVKLSIEGRDYSLQRRGEEFWVEMDDPDGLTDDIFGRRNRPARVWRRVMMTTGSHHMQMYWFSNGRGRMLQKFPFVWLTTEHRWIPRSGAYVAPVRDDVPFHEPLDTGDWNVNCIRCHTTQGRPRIDWSTGWADTHVADLSIGCEACHGPGEAHVRANQSPLRRYAKHLSGKADSTIINPAKLTPAKASQICGQCHAANSFYENDDGKYWNEHGYPYRPGDELSDTRFTIRGRQDEDKPWVQELLAENPIFMDATFWSDDKIRVSGREYNGLIASPCFQRGEMGCMSCHVLHQLPTDSRPVEHWADDMLGPGMRGNQACLQCHQEKADDIQAHTHHAPNSAGSECYNCHMPHTTYGLLKAIRSHTVDSPHVRESVEFRRPNACNLCHLDQTLEWTGQHLADWYGQPVPKLSQLEQQVAAGPLWLVRGDAAQRAITAWHLKWSSARQAAQEDWMTPYLVQLLDDPYPSVRLQSWRALRQQAEFKEFTYDYVGTAEHRAQAKREAWKLWRQRDERVKRREQKGLLFGEDGTFDSSRFDELLIERDDREVLLQE